MILDARFAWFRCGTVSATATVLTFSPSGLPAYTLTTTTAGAPANTPGGKPPSPNSFHGDANLSIPLLAGKPFGISSSGKSVAQIGALLAAQKAKELAKIAKTFGAHAAEAEAVQATIIWNWISTPAENGPLLPVSRSWNFAPGPANNDFTYAVFDWDNIFASLLAGISNKSIAYSNLIQVMKSKTAAGFVPNYGAGGAKSQDRTEPPVGAKVLLSLYEKYNDKWIVELLYDDCLEHDAGRAL